MVDPVAFDKASIELPAEARIARQHKVAQPVLNPSR